MRRRYRQTMQLPKPPAGCARQMGRDINVGFQFQTRLTIRGACRVRGLQLYSEPRKRIRKHGLPEEVVFVGGGSFTGVRYGHISLRRKSLCFDLATPFRTSARRRRTGKSSWASAPALDALSAPRPDLPGGGLRSILRKRRLPGRGESLRGSASRPVSIGEVADVSARSGRVRKSRSGTRKHPHICQPRSERDGSMSGRQSIRVHGARRSILRLQPSRGGSGGGKQGGATRGGVHRLYQQFGNPDLFQ